MLIDVQNKLLLLFCEYFTLLYKLFITYQLICSDGHVLNATPRERNAIEDATRFPAVDPQSILSRTEKTLAFWMKVDGSWGRRKEA